ncbi:hypothetical protein VBD025_07775 [Virgibacillus flavescens]|uniref:hypothetical protein n=1 Tax=Virgibacillus flavescens TaxID=1611422 RepID=UPI003D34464B
MQFSYMIKSGQEHTYYRVINGPEMQENENSGLGNLQKSTIKKFLKKVSLRRTQRNTRKDKNK